LQWAAELPGWNFDPVIVTEMITFHGPDLIHRTVDRDWMVGAFHEGIIATTPNVAVEIYTVRRLLMQITDLLMWPSALDKALPGRLVKSRHERIGIFYVYAIRVT